MNRYSLEIIEAVRLKTTTKTNYAVSKALGMTQGTLNKILAGDRNLSNKGALKASELLGRDFKTMLIMLEQDRARSPDEREFWQRRMEQVHDLVDIMNTAPTALRAQPRRVKRQASKRG
jgi:plasmid maintenance system antidote protein VapI